jgi:hypothetical protein
MERSVITVNTVPGELELVDGLGVVGEVEAVGDVEGEAVGVGVVDDGAVVAHVIDPAATGSLGPATSSSSVSAHAESEVVPMSSEWSSNTYVPLAVVPEVDSMCFVSRPPPPAPT